MASKIILFATLFLFSSQALARDLDSDGNADEKTWKKFGHFPKEFKLPELPKFGHEGVPKIHVKKPEGATFKKFPHFKLPKISFPFKGLPKPKHPHHP